MAIFLAGLAAFICAAVCLAWIRTNLILGPDILPNVNTPDLFGLPYEKVTFSSKDGAKLSGWWVPALSGVEGAGHSDKTILLCHGWGTNSGDILSSTWYLAKEGFNLFYFDLRGCGDSPRHGFCSLGYFESRDLEAAFEYLQKEKSAHLRRFGIYGLSLGGALSIWAGAHPVSKNVQCAFMEAPFESFSVVIQRYIHHFFKLPKFPFADFYVFLLYLRTGFVDHEAASPLRQAVNFKIPKALLTYGEEDWLAVPAAGEKIVAAMRQAGSQVEWWLAPKAGHADIFGRYPELYRRKVTDFFKTNLV